jgi:hypothetical protein
MPATCERIVQAGSRFGVTATLLPNWSRGVVLGLSLNMSWCGTMKSCQCEGSLFAPGIIDQPFPFA